MVHNFIPKTSKSVIIIKASFLAALGCWVSIMTNGWCQNKLTNLPAILVFYSGNARMNLPADLHDGNSPRKCKDELTNSPGNLPRMNLPAVTVIYPGNVRMNLPAVLVIHQVMPG